VAEHVEAGAVGQADRAQVARARADLVEMQFARQRARGGIADHRGERLDDGVGGGDAGVGAQVVAGLQHRQPVRQAQQGTMRLDAAGEADWFFVATRQVQRGELGSGLGHRVGQCAKH
jgi:hypothetical protein